MVNDEKFVHILYNILINYQSASAGDPLPLSTLQFNSLIDEIAFTKHVLKFSICLIIILCILCGSLTEEIPYDHE
ncbi:hypothetical protein T12_13589 [Trichinella patagoniensis]|uniref:Uncharacterized protein n=1 Tax=Trichinella patagoniensis TaxID=990121 RepID=A0A0V1AAQ3_9BILA|nr:hypothetical protein T12_13589 [Trichinella patagoniensis]